MATTVLMKVSPRARDGIIRLARQQKTRAWVVLDSLLSATLLEGKTLNMQQKTEGRALTRQGSRVLPSS
jgi:hypothetical protein